MANSNLTAAKTAKNDEFYTELSEIQAELRHYSDKFCGKTVFCNCDDPFESNFVKYFLMNFNRLGLKELIATGYKTSPIGGSEVGSPKSPYVLRIKETKKYLIGDQTDLDVRGAKWLLDAEGPNIMTPLIGNLAKDKDGNQIMEEISEIYVDKKTGKEKKRKTKRPFYYEAGDFRSDISIELLKESDIVVTNPPFSLFREYVAQLMEYEKLFLILGSLNAITYKEIFPLLKNNQIWLGCQSGSKTYVVPESFAKEFPNKITKQGNTYITKMGNTGWFTNIDHEKRHQMLPLDLGFTYYGHEDMYPKYDNYDAINVDKVSQIPCDYEPCWYTCSMAGDCAYAKSCGKDDNAFCEHACNGQIGVPITFLDKHCPDQFDVIGADFDLAEKVDLGNGKFGTGRFYVTAEQSRAEQSRADCTVELLSGRRKCNGIIGVPITFLDKYCPEQFRVVANMASTQPSEYNFGYPYIAGDKKYARILIQKMQRSDGGSDNVSG